MSDQEIAAAIQRNVPPPRPSMGDVALNAVPKGIANLLNTPVAFWNLAKQAAGAMHPQIKEYATPTPNYPMQGAEALGLVDPAKNPQTPEQRVVDAMVQGAVGMPGGLVGGALKGMATGAAAAGAGQMTTELTGSPLAGTAVSMATPFAVRRLARPDEAAANAARDQTLREGRKAGLVIPPTRVNPSFVQKRLEGVAGKAALGQEAASRNQAVTNRLAAQDVEIPPNTPLTPPKFSDALRREGRSYEDVKNLQVTPQMPWFPRYHQGAASMVEEMKQARADANKIEKGLLTQYDPDAIKRAKALRHLSDSLEDDLRTIAKAQGKEDLIDAMVKSRTKIAKIHNLMNVTSDSGEVSAPMLSRIGEETELTGNLGLIKRFHDDFPKVMREGSKVPTAGTGQLESFAMGQLGLEGAQVGKGGWLAAGWPLVAGPTRSLLLSPTYQRFFAQPDYSGLTPQERVIQSLLAGRTQAGLTQEQP